MANSTEPKLTKKDKLKQAQSYCHDCLKFDKKEKKCIAFTELYPLWGSKDECWGRVTSPAKWLRTIREIDSYHDDGSGHLTPTQERWKEFTSSEEMKMVNLIGVLHPDSEHGSYDPYEGLHEVYNEELKRGKGGGGEKADRTNKTFGPQQMKDNRFQHRKLNPRKYNEWL